MSEERVRIERCPHCQSAHIYRLEVERTVIMKVSTGKQREKPTSVKTSQIFTCPSKNERYRASLLLEDTSSDRIRAVTVIGLADE